MAARILVSEADPAVRRLLVTLLERLGHDAVALEPDVLEPPDADLLLVDPAAPACLDHARLVRMYFPELPVLCLSALPDRGRFLERGPVRFLPKPFTVDGLEAALR